MTDNNGVVFRRINGRVVPIRTGGKVFPGQKRNAKQRFMDGVHTGIKPGMAVGAGAGLVLAKPRRLMLTMAAGSVAGAAAFGAASGAFNSAFGSRMHFPKTQAQRESEKMGVSKAVGLAFAGAVVTGGLLARKSLKLSAFKGDQFHRMKEHAGGFTVPSMKHFKKSWELKKNLRKGK